MDRRSAALKLVLDHLGTNDISTMDHRMEVQKAVYLAQTAGVPLGYSYGWYVRGPYSPSLTRDYFDLTDDVPAGMTLKGTAATRLNQVRDLMNDRVANLGRPAWLELVASIHYLIKQSGLSEQTARRKFSDYKPHLSMHYTSGLAKLKAHGFI